MVSKTSEFLHNAWGTNTASNQQGETWENIKEGDDDWNVAKSEVKTETDWGVKKSMTKEEDWDWNDEKSLKENNDGTSNW